jgi:hypothetical protein
LTFRRPELTNLFSEPFASITVIVGSFLPKHSRIAFLHNKPAHPYLGYAFQSSLFLENLFFQFHSPKPSTRPRCCHTL